MLDIERLRRILHKELDSPGFITQLFFFVIGPTIFLPILVSWKYFGYFMYSLGIAAAMIGLGFLIFRIGWRFRDISPNRWYFLSILVVIIMVVQLVFFITLTGQDHIDFPTYYGGP